MSDLDLLVRRGRWFDGTGAPSYVADVAIRDGVVVEVTREEIDVDRAARVIDAQGHWVTPGFVDNHTHYDAEVLLAPGLGESVRHGVTTITMGSCSLSTIHVTPEDAADIFSRVEALPRAHVLAALQDRRDWDDAAAYVRALETLALGPNIAMYLGHSDLRVGVMGLGRSVDRDQKPNRRERALMREQLEAALDEGFLGMSSMTNPWDKLDGDRYRSKQLPSTYARWSEYRYLNRVLRARGRIHQSAPNLTTKINLVLFYMASAGRFGRRTLKTTLITAADVKTNPSLWRLFQGAPAANRLLKADLRWQHLPVPFEVYADGIDLVIFEEFGAGAAAMHLADDVARNELLDNEGYRAWFRKQYEQRFTPRVWNRNFHDADIVDCPDAAVVGKSFGQVADERGVHPVDAYLDLVVEHGAKLRWRTTVTNHRPEVLDKLAQVDELLFGFSDAGAHLRNMAFYNFGTRFLARVLDRERKGTPIMSMEQAVHRLTGQLADWHTIDAGHLRVGDRADLCIIDPAGLTEQLDEYHEAPVEVFGGLSRMVNRGEAVRTTVVAGNVLWHDGEFAQGFGRDWRAGRFLRAEEGPGTVDPATIRANPAAHSASTNTTKAST
ncbi:MAG: N-acyl-D-aspartate/D-glutamate deacylase [Glaciecola sp.]